MRTSSALSRRVGNQCAPGLISESPDHRQRWLGQLVRNADQSPTEPMQIGTSPVVASTPTVAHALRNVVRAWRMIQAKRVPTGDLDTDRAIAEVREVANRLAAVPLLDGAMLEDVTLVDGATTKINHALGRKWRGWFLVDISGASTSGRIESAVGADESKQLWLTATGWGASLTVSLWVF